MGLCHCCPNFHFLKQKITVEPAKANCKINDQVIKSTPLPICGNIMPPVLLDVNLARLSRRVLPVVIYSREIVTFKHAKDKDKYYQTPNLMPVSTPKNNLPRHGKSPVPRKVSAANSERTVEGPKLATVENAHLNMTYSQL